MLVIKIPGRDTIALEVLILDFNGTVALDGKLFESVKANLVQLAPFLEIHIITADTFGTVESQCQDLAVHVKVLESANHTQEKADYLAKFNARHVAAIGNGSNDQLMLERASLGIAVIGFEGASMQTLLSADVVVNNIEGALGLLIKPQRLRATLRR
ncbi:ATPase P [Desulfosporosinus sp. PR]|uniref:HAD family hydrolase n=1 Tax=Candidatus Desulfosporosinus nitrosoreducens TaxID=3401928 RepID=UPI0027F6CBF3|nr:ATPase P [Desulfosporosinus sp. PR]MDQ7095874.1 ATPase P [Desulfosporosinus sp. PR]